MQVVDVGHEQVIHTVGHGHRMLVLPVRSGRSSPDDHHRHQVFADLEIPERCQKSRIILIHRRQKIFVFGFRPVAARGQQGRRGEERNEYAFHVEFRFNGLNGVYGYLTAGLQSHHMRVAMLSEPPSISTALA